MNARSLLARLFRRGKLHNPARPPYLYRIGGVWGDKVEWQNFAQGRVVGWKAWRAEKGDLLLAAMKSGRTGVYRFVEAEHCDAPHDMFFGRVKAVGYSDEPTVADLVAQAVDVDARMADFQRRVAEVSQP